MTTPAIFPEGSQLAGRGVPGSVFLLLFVNLSRWLREEPTLSMAVPRMRLHRAASTGGW